MALFGKKTKKDEKTKKPDQTPDEFKNVSAGEEKETASIPKVLPTEYGVLKGFYVSEKATSLNSFGQYVFKVFKNTTKNEVRKQVEKSFNVKVDGVKIINLPGKIRSSGRRVGFKPGFKKAIVVLKEGYSIEQAKV